MVKTSAAPESTPHSAEGGDNKGNDQRNRFDEIMYQRNLFMSMALSITWQLALVVVVPIVGGYALDQHYHKSPWLTIVGLAIAVIGVFGVLHRIVTEAGQRSGYGGSKKS